MTRKKKQFKQIPGWIGYVVVGLVCVVGVIIVALSGAAGPFTSAEPENGTAVAPAAVLTDTTASGGKAVKFSPASTTENKYRPIKVTDPKQLPHAPQDANYVMWNFPAGTMLHQAFQTLGANDILVLPERAEPYEIDSSRGFLNDSSHYYSMARAKRGLVGMGPGVIVQPSASSFSLPRSTSSEGNEYRVMESLTNGAYFGNFEMRGRKFGDAAYDAIWQRGSNSVWERIYFNGAHRGWKNSPPGETGAISGYEGTNQQVYNVEVDCRDPATGARVGTSPFMFNVQSNVRVDDFYGHHAIAGMPTFWKVNNITTNRLRSEFNGTGNGTIAGQGINHEIVSGTVTHNDPTIFIDLASGNVAWHISIGTNTTTATYNINRPVYDRGQAGAGIFSMILYQYPGNTQNPSTIFVKNATGGNVPTDIERP